MKRIFLVTLLSLSLLASCGNKYPAYEETFEYSDFNEYKLDNVKNMYSQDEGVYGVYFYQTTCETCNNIKNTVLGYMNDYKNGEKTLKIYLYNTANLKIDYPSVKQNDYNEKELRSYLYDNNVNKIEDTYINATPSLYVISDKRIYDYYQGENVLEFIFSTSLNSSTYDKRSYYDYSSNLLDSLDNFYLKEEEIYYVYLFYIGCPYCANIKKNILDYIEKEDSTKVYMFNMKRSSFASGKENRNRFNIPNDVSSSEDFSSKYVEAMKENHINNVEDTYFKYVPSLYIVQNGKFSNAIIGSSTIVEFLS